MRIGDLEKSGPFDPRHLAARTQVWKIIRQCIGTNTKMNLQIKEFAKSTDGRAKYIAIESFLLGSEHANNMINKAEKILSTTTFTQNAKNWKIEDYVTKHVQAYSIIREQHDLGNHADMHERCRGDLFLAGVKNKHNKMDGYA